jgi:thioredoxin-dependent peroxiredoxin
MYRMVLRHDVGGQAPGFTLKDGTGREVALDSFRPNIVVLVFFTGGFDRDALRGLREFARSNQRIRDSDAVVVAITPELPGKVQTLVENMSLPFTVLSDPEMKVVKEYDIYNPVTNWTWPAAFIIDKEGVIQYAFRGASPPNTPPVDYIGLKLTWMKEGKTPAAAGKART